MEFEDLLWDTKDHIAYITINRPQVLNATSPVTQDELEKAFHLFDEDDNLWVAILTSTGDRAFCAGHDMKWEDAHPAEQARRTAEAQKTRRKTPYFHLHNLQTGDSPRVTFKPIIAAVKGYCLGGGFEIAMNCDFIVAGENASFGLPEVTRGWPPTNGSFSTPRHIPLKIAMEMVLFGDRISAQRAYELGLVNRVAPVEKVMETAEAMARRLCENPPLAVRAGKELVLRGLDMPVNYAPLAWHMLADGVTRMIRDSEDRVEGRLAFVEKRKPNYKGR